MADVKAAPPLASASENLQNEVSQNSKPKSSGHRRRGGAAVYQDPVLALVLPLRAAVTLHAAWDTIIISMTHDT